MRGKKKKGKRKGEGEKMRENKERPDSVIRSFKKAEKEFKS